MNAPSPEVAEVPPVVLEEEMADVDVEAAEEAPDADAEASPLMSERDEGESTRVCAQARVLSEVWCSQRQRR